MPPRERFDRWKAELKDLFSFSSPGRGTPSLPNSRQPSPSPGPPALLRAVTPQPNAAGPLIHIQPGSHLLSPIDVFPSHVIATTITSVPPSALDPQPSVLTPPDPPGPSQIVPPEGTNIERTKSTLWSGLRALLKVVDASADIFPPLKEAVGGLNQCVEIFESASKGRKDYGELRSNLDSLLDDLSQFLGEPAGPMMTTSMKNLSFGINEELKLVREKHERGVLRRHAEALEDVDEIMDCYRRIQGYLQRLNVNANLSLWKMADEQATEARLLRLLPTMSAVYNSAESEDVRRRPCAAGTRGQELVKLREWTRDGTAGDIYWMNGMAGTGKTTIAYSLCDELDKTAELGASFFCSRQIPECRNVKLILPAIAYQLARFSYPFQCSLSRVLKADPDVHTRVLKTQYEKLLVQPLLEAKSALPADFVVVIDALDECENENTVGQILDLLLQRSDTPDLPIRFLVSSRPEPEIYRRMMGQIDGALGGRLVLHELDKVKVEHDIETYLRLELKDIAISPSQLADLVEQSGVLFIYAATAARYIKDGVAFMEHEERLNVVLGLVSHSTDRNRDINALYLTILQAAFENPKLDKTTQERMKNVLDTVICAQEPMTLDALASLLQLKSSQLVGALLRPLSSVINISETTELVTTLHASFPDFMLDQGRSSNLYCDSTITHGRLSRACLELVRSNKPQFNICGFESSCFHDKDITDINERASQAVSAALFYACRYWITHFELVHQCTDLGGLLYDFLSARLLLWMEVLNVKRCMHLGPKIIQRAEEWSRANDCAIATIELAHDAWRFVTMFTSHPVSQSTPHIYTSMLPFWPISSPVAEHYTKVLRGAINVRGTAILKRPLALLATWSFDNAVQSARFSPDGSLIVFGVSSSVCVIDGTTGKTVIGPLQHEGTVTSVTFSPDGRLIVSGSDNQTIRIWGAQNGKEVVAPLKGHSRQITSVSFSSDSTRVVSGSYDDTIRIWDVETGQTVLGPLQGHTDWVRSVCFSPDDSRVISGSDDRTIQVWDAKSGERVLSQCRGHTRYVLSVCCSHDGGHFASGSRDGTIRVWSAESGKSIAGPLEGHSGDVLSTAFSPDNNQIASGSRDKTIRLWDLNSSPISARTLEGHTSPVTSVAFSSDGSRIVSCSDDKTIRVWDARTRATVADSLEGHTGAVYSVGFSPDGKHIVSGSGDKTIRMWDAESGQMVGGPLEGHTGVVRSVCFSPDGTRIASGSGDKSIRVWDVLSRQTVIGPLKGHEDWVRVICFSPDGGLIASGSDDKTIRVWDSQNGNPVGNPLEGHGAYVQSVCFSPDSTRIASGSDDRTIRVRDSRSGQTVVEPLKGHTGIILSVCFSPNGTRIASGSSDKTARVWDAQSGQPIFDPLEGHTNEINSVCFSPDGTLIVSGSDDKTIRLWDARRGRAIGDPLVGHTELVWSVAFSPDGVHIVSGSADQTIRVWDVSGLLRMYGVTGYLPSPEPAPISPPRSHESWVLREDGWAVDPEGHLLVWVPPDLHLRLIRPCDTSIISPNGSFKLDFSSANLGESWAGCYQTPSC